MIYTQTISPNLTTIGNAGWCLWFVEQDYGVPHLDASAEDAWNACHFPHPLEQPPNATVPVYWTYFDTGENMEFGHIAIWVPGRGIFSSPFDIAIGNQWFSSIQAVTDRINQIKGANARYLGWSEDLAGVQIINQGGTFMVDQNLLTNFYQTLFGRAPDAGAQGWIGKPADVVFQDLILSDEYKAIVATRAKTLSDLEAKLTAYQASAGELDKWLAVKALLKQIIPFVN